MLLGARPGHGKTLLGLELAAAAASQRQAAFFFTLDYNAQDVEKQLSDLGYVDLVQDAALTIDTSDEVSSDYIIARLQHAHPPAFAVIDYLQLLDQKRSNLPLEFQINALRMYAQETGAICIAISQIDRAFDLSGRKMPSRSDVRLPNPLDLSLFDSFCFLHNGEIKVENPA